MNRHKALAMLTTICQRLEAASQEDFFVIPLRLYGFGSVLTDKPTPTDIDLLFQYRERPDLNVGEVLSAMVRGQPLPHDRAIQSLRKGLRMVRMELLAADSSVVQWLESHAFAATTPVRLLWEPGLDWRQVLEGLETGPLPWNPALEQRNKWIQETAQQLMRDKGPAAARDWMRSVQEAAAGLTDQMPQDDTREAPR